LGPRLLDSTVHMQTDMFCRRGTDCVQPSAIERAHATVSVSTCVLELRREIERETCQMQPHSPNQLKSDLQLLHRTEALCVCVCVWRTSCAISVFLCEQIHPHSQFFSLICSIVAAQEGQNQLAVKSESDTFVFRGGGALLYLGEKKLLPLICKENLTVG